MASVDDVLKAVVDDVGSPWRISCMYYRVVTGVVSCQESRDLNCFKKACKHGTSGEGPVDHHPRTFAQQAPFEGPVLT